MKCIVFSAWCYVILNRNPLAKFSERLINQNFQLLSTRYLGPYRTLIFLRSCPIGLQAALQLSKVVQGRPVVQWIWEIATIERWISSPVKVCRSVYLQLRLYAWWTGIPNSHTWSLVFTGKTNPNSESSIVYSLAGFHADGAFFRFTVRIFIPQKLWFRRSIP